MKNPETREHQKEIPGEASSGESTIPHESESTDANGQDIIIDELYLKKTHSRKSILNWLNNLNFWQD